jgi:hypothetical protein
LSRAKSFVSAFEPPAAAALERRRHAAYVAEAPHNNGGRRFHWWSPRSWAFVQRAFDLRLNAPMLCYGLGKKLNPL